VKAVYASRSRTAHVEVEVEVEDVSAEASEVEAWEQRDADGLVEMAEAFLAHGPSASPAPEATQVIVHTRLGAGRIRESSVEAGVNLPGESADQLACDSSVVEIVEDEAGQPLNVGRRTRKVPVALRRALQVRDGVCRFHHQFVHRRHWHIEMAQDGTFTFEDATGRPYPEQLPWTGTPDELSTVHRRAGIAIDTNTLRPESDGFGIDYNYVIDVLADAALDK
jgi:hypothetical protein